MCASVRAQEGRAKTLFSVLEIYFKITISQINYAFTPSYNLRQPRYSSGSVFHSKYTII